MPAALATVSAATSQAQAAVGRNATTTAPATRGFDVPSDASSAPPASATASATSSLGYPYTLKKRESDDALSAGSGSGGSTANLSGFAEIRREEAEGAIPAAPASGARRTSGGWFWGKDKDKEKDKRE